MPFFQIRGSLYQLLSIVALAALAVSTAAADAVPAGDGEHYTLSHTFPTKVGNSAEVFDPKGIALDAQNNVYVTGSQRGAEVYSYKGTWLGTFGAKKQLGGVADTAGGNVYFPFGIAVDHAGAVYIVDDLTETIQKFQNNGSYVTGIHVPGKVSGQPTLMIGIAVDSQGTILATDATSKTVLRFQPDGTPLPALGSPGKGDGQFTEPRFIAVDGDRINVVDDLNHKVLVYRNDGVFVRAFGANGFANGQFATPQGVGTDANHNIYVADGTRIQKFSYNGTFLTSIEIPTTVSKDPGFNGHYHYSVTLSGVQGIAVDKNGNIFVADTNNKRIAVFTPSR